MFLSGSEKLCSKDQYSFITIFEEFKQSCWGAEINRQFLFHMVHPMGEPSTGLCRSSTSSLAHERELWVCSSECPVCIRKVCRNTQESKSWSFSAPLGRTVRHALCLGCGIRRDSLHAGLTTVSSCLAIQSRCGGCLSRYVSILLCHKKGLSALFWCIPSHADGM